MTDHLNEDGAVIAALRLEVHNARLLNSSLRQRETELTTQVGQLRAEVSRLQDRCDLQSGRIEELEGLLTAAGAERRP